MGKIMKDGKQYGVGGIQKAESITYDNTDSGMTATNVQGALDELNNGLITTNFFTKTIGESVSAGGVKSYTIPVSLSGYRALGIIQISGSGTGNFAFQDQSLINNNTTANIYVRNVSSNAATINSLSIVVLYLKA